MLGGGFTIDNPNAIASCGCGSSFRTATNAGKTRRMLSFRRNRKIFSDGIKSLERSFLWHKTENACKVTLNLI